MIRWLVSATTLFLSIAPAIAADLAKVDRTIGKQPTYTGKPEYCLLVFGREAKDRVWLVRDGDALFVDRNGNGDLTEPGKKVVAEKDNSNLAFHVGALRVGKLEHRNLVVRATKLAAYGDEIRTNPAARAALAKDKDTLSMIMSAEIEVPGLKGNGDDGRLKVRAQLDAEGPLLFGDSPATAPVLHLGGPLHMRSELATPTLYRNVPYDLMLLVGTPGIGPGTFAFVEYEKLIPQDAFVVVDAVFPPQKPGDPPIKEQFELKERC